MEALSQRYGWTPNQIREQPTEDILQYLEIIKEISKQEKIRQMKQK
jgi:hypothetical protein